MRIIFSIILSFTCFLNVNAQLVTNAGNDIHSCDMDTNANAILIGGSPTASNGTLPYTYSWTIAPIELGFPGSGLFFSASDILNDTSVANPILIERYAATSIDFFLKVTDATGVISYDTCKFSFSNFMQHLMNYSWLINSGDSAFIDVGSNVGGGVGTLSYLWQPSNSLSDSTLEIGFWARPSTTTNYFVTVTDSLGCSMTERPFCSVNVNPLNIDHLEVRNILNVFPNPTSSLLNISYSMTTNTPIKIINSQGHIVKEILNQQEFGNTTLVVDTKQFTSGIYYIIMTDGQNSKQTKFIIQ